MCSQWLDKTSFELGGGDYYDIHMSNPLTPEEKRNNYEAARIAERFCELDVDFVNAVDILQNAIIKTVALASDNSQQAITGYDYVIDCLIEARNQVKKNFNAK